MNPTSSHTAIQEIKLKIKELKSGIAKRNSLQKKREELENFLLEAQLKAQHALLKAHQISQPESMAALALYDKAKEYEELSKELLQKLTLVDKEIDSWEDVEESEITALQNQLIDSILKNHPQEQRAFDELQLSLRAWEGIEHKNNRLLTLLANLEHLITTMQITRKRIKSQGILSYIFGSSPTVMVTQCLQGIATVLREEKDKIAAMQEFLPEKTMRDAVAALYSYSLELEEDCQMRWSYRRLDALIEKNFIRIEEFKALFEQFHTEILAQKQKKEDELQIWLSQF